MRPIPSLREIPAMIRERAARGSLGLLRMGKAPAIACAASLVASALVALAFDGPGGALPPAYEGFEAGQVADRDVFAETDVSFVDAEATALRMEAERNMIPAVFGYLPEAAAASLAAWDAFADFAARLVEEGASRAILALRIQSEFPGLLPDEAASAFLDLDPAEAALRGRGALAQVMAGRVFDLAAADMGAFNPDYAELVTRTADRVERERVPVASMTHAGNLAAALAGAAEGAGATPVEARIVAAVAAPFARENAVFLPSDTEALVAWTMAQVPPVVRTLERGHRVIRQGFVISEDEARDFVAMRDLLPEPETHGRGGRILLLVLLHVLFALLRGRAFTGREMSAGQSCLLFALLFASLAGSAAAAGIAPAGLPAALFFPSALMVMTAAVFMGNLAAFALALAFPLGALALGFFDVPSFVFAVASGASAAVLFREAEKRMDLLRAGLRIAAANCLAAAAILAIDGAEPSAAVFLWAAINGLASGMLMLGVLPPLEQILNAPTAFRLIELSDLNAPILRKLFTAAPGTYSHSVMVATLAEQACQDIGANALLARVGAYYHDIGKMENPDYFVENQTDHNRHDDIAPRLSATVIRSHIKIGVEKVRQLGLPEEVADIVGEHHGNSLIVWFHKKAEEREGHVNAEDFTYPGSPPRSREAAVVMLADVTEAAVRTLDKPTAPKMERFIQQLMDEKVASGQLAQSDLSFRDLGAIKAAFVRVLAGYYHSRIAYPKVADGEEAGK